MSTSSVEVDGPVTAAGDRGSEVTPVDGQLAARPRSPRQRQAADVATHQRRGNGVHGRRARLRREHIHAPITALAIYSPVSSSVSGRQTSKRYLLAAEDTDLKIYDVTTRDGSEGGRDGGDAAYDRVVDGGSLVGQIRVFAAQPIHGLSVQRNTRAARDERRGNKESEHGEDDDNDDDRVLVWGGDSVAVLSARALLLQHNSTSTGDNDNVDEDDARGSGSGHMDIPVFRAPDWIFDAKISPFDRDNVVMLTAHNEIVEAKIATTTTTTTTDSMSMKLLSVHSPSRPILYAGNLLWLGPDCVLVAAGTVFGEVVVWKWHARTNDATGQVTREEEARCEHLFAFTGHEGSIFGIQISPEIVLPGPEGRRARLLATCSDDRTVRVWDITDRQESLRGSGFKLDKGQTSVPRARETGFGPNGDVLKVVKDEEEESGRRDGESEDDDSSRRSVAVAMGHISRIWHVEFAEPLRETPGVFPIYSCGEDATTQKWHLSFGPQQQQMQNAATLPPKPIGTTVSTLGEASLTHQAIFRNHTGKHIWSRALLPTENGGAMIATGGSDGKIVLVHDEGSDKSAAGRSTWREAFSISRLVELSGVEPILEHKPAIEVVEPAEDMEGKKPKKKAKPPKESFQRYAFISEDKLLVITNQGRCFTGSFSDQGIRWKVVPMSEEKRLSLSGYSVVASCPATSVAYIGTSRGEIYALSDADDAELQLVATVEGKVADLFCLGTQSQESDPASSGVKLMVTVLGSTTASILSIEGHDRVSEIITVELEKGAIVTAASLVKDTLILGTRTGVLSIFGRGGSGSAYRVVHSLPGKLADAITSIVALPRQTESTENCYFLTTCRDGKYRIYQRRTDSAASTSVSTPQQSIILLQETAPPFGPLIEQAWFATDPVTKTTELMLCGFRSTNAVLWNATQQREVASVECGGAHRSFAMTRQSKSSSSEGFRFVFNKASEMHVFSQMRSQAQTLKTGSHGREIRAVSFSGRYTATAAEDTVIRIHEYIRPSSASPGDCRKSTSSTGKFRCVATIEKHATGIQTLRWHKNNHLFSSGGNEEFFVWKVNKIDSDVCPLGIACEAVFKDKSAIGDLRIMDFDVELLSDDSSGGDGGQEEDGASQQFCITMALSNSTVQSYLYSSHTREFKLLGRQHYTGACLMQLRHLGFSSSTDASGYSQPHILTASTDGRLAVFIGTQPGLGIEPVAIDDISDVSPLEAAALIRPASEKTSLITKIHQSGIKSLDMLRINPPSTTTTAATAATSYIIATGGDDNAIGITHLSFSPGTGTYTVQGRYIVRSAHAAAVTGIGIARIEGASSDVIVVSTSNDQRVKTWRVVDWQGQGKTRILLESDEYSGVADCGDLEIVHGDGGEGLSCGYDDGGGDDDGVQFLVGGVGMEVWRV